MFVLCICMVDGQCVCVSPFPRLDDRKQRGFLGGNERHEWVCMSPCVLYITLVVEGVR